MKLHIIDAPVHIIPIVDGQTDHPLNYLVSFLCKRFFYISFRFVLLTKNAYKLIPHLSSHVIFFSHKNSHSCLSNLTAILDLGHQCLPGGFFDFIK